MTLILAAALLTGLGCFDNIAEAAETVTYDRVFEPSASDYYAERVELYGSLYETLKKANHTLSSL